MTAEYVLQSDIEEIAKRLGEAAHEFAGKTVVLTGACGFLGLYFTEVFSYLSNAVLAKPVTVIGLDNLIAMGTNSESLQDRPHMRFVRHNVIEPFTCDDSVDYVIHAASIPSPFYYRAYPLETLHVNITGTQNMLELATRHRARFIFFSSSEIYGNPDRQHIPTPESYRGYVACQGPRACYDESKRLGETLCYVFHEKYGTATNSIRPFNAFGPGMQEVDYRVLPNFGSCIKGERPLKVYGTGNQTRTFCYITDLMVGCLLTALRGVPGEAYNIGTDKPEVSVLELVRRIDKVLKRKLHYDVIEYPDSYPADEPERRCPDIRKARLQLKFKPQVELDEGLRRFFSWTDRVYSGE